MFEYHPSQFEQALPLLSGIPQKVLPQAICEGYTPARIFVDTPHNPKVALAWTQLGYFLLAGDPAQTDILPALRETLTTIFVPSSQAQGENSFILMPDRAAWHAHLPELLPNREVIEIYRRPFHFEPERFTAFQTRLPNLPPQFQLKILDAAHIEAVGLPPGWDCAEDFLTHGVGAALFNGDELVSLCASVFASSTQMEIDLHTEERYRRQDFAQITAAAFITACLQSGKQPNWECFWENDASSALAEKLGFRAEPDYPVYYWEE